MLKKVSGVELWPYRQRLVFGGPRLTPGLKGKFSPLREQLTCDM